jgi:hypothetical protein
MTIALMIFSLGVISSTVSLPAKVWWNKGPADARYVVSAAALINQSDRPLLISQVSFNRVIELGYELKPDASYQLVPEGQLPNLPSDRRPVFIFRPSEAFQVALKRMTHQSLSPLPGTNNTIYKLE